MIKFYGFVWLYIKKYAYQIYDNGGLTHLDRCRLNNILIKMGVKDAYYLDIDGFIKFYYYLFCFKFKAWSFFCSIKYKIKSM